MSKPGGKPNPSKDPLPKSPIGDPDYPKHIVTTTRREGRTLCGIANVETTPRSIVALSWAILNEGLVCETCFDAIPEGRR